MGGIVSRKGRHAAHHSLLKTIILRIGQEIQLVDHYGLHTWNLHLHCDQRICLINRYSSKLRSTASSIVVSTETKLHIKGVLANCVHFQLILTSDFNATICIEGVVQCCYYIKKPH